MRPGRGWPAPAPGQHQHLLDDWYQKSPTTRESDRREAPGPCGVTVEGVLAGQAKGCFITDLRGFSPSAPVCSGRGALCGWEGGPAHQAVFAASLVPTHRKPAAPAAPVLPQVLSSPQSCVCDQSSTCPPWAHQPRQPPARTSEMTSSPRKASSPRELVSLALEPQAGELQPTAKATPTGP